MADPLASSKPLEDDCNALRSLLAARDEEIVRLQTTITQLTERIATLESVQPTPTTQQQHKQPTPGRSGIPLPVFNHNAAAFSPQTLQRRISSRQITPRTSRDEISKISSQSPLPSRSSVISITELSSASSLFPTSPATPPSIPAESSPLSLTQESTPQYAVDQGGVRVQVRNRTMTIFPAKNFTPSEGDGDLPQVTLQLGRVLGYRSKGVRNNLIELPTGDTVYSIGVWCVILQVDGSQRVYSEHSGDVYCLALNTKESVVASGQTLGPRPLDTAHVRIWSPETLQTRVVLDSGQFQRAVSCLAFSPADPSLLVSVDDGPQHLIVIWSWASATALTQIKGHTEHIAAVGFNPATYQLITCGKQHVNFWTVAPSEVPGSIQLIRKPGLFQNNPKPKLVTSICFSPRGDTVTGDSNGCLFSWGPAMPSHTIIHAIRDAHKGGVAALAATDHGFLSAGAQDGYVRIWTWGFQPYPVQNGQVNALHIDHPIRTIFPASTSDGLSLSQFTVGTCENSILNADAADGSVIPIMIGPPSTVCSASSLGDMYLTASEEGLLAWDGKTHTLLWTWLPASIEQDGAQIVSVDAVSTTPSNITTTTATTETTSAPTEPTTAASDQQQPDSTTTTAVVDVSSTNNISNDAGATSDGPTIAVSNDDVTSTTSALNGEQQPSDNPLLPSLSSFPRANSGSRSNVCRSPTAGVGAGAGAGVGGAENACVEGLVVAGLSCGIALLDHTGQAKSFTNDPVGVVLVRFSPCAKYVAVGRVDNTVAVYRVQGFALTLVETCRGVQAPLATIDWSQDSTCVQVSTSSFELCTWRVENGEIVRGSEASMMMMASRTSRIGWPCLALMHCQVPIVGADCSMDNKLIVAGDDLGALRVYKYPAYRPAARAVIGRGFGGPLNVVRFLDETSVLCCSTLSNVLCVWHLIPSRNSLQENTTATPTSTMLFGVSGSGGGNEGGGSEGVVVPSYHRLPSLDSISVESGEAITTTPPAPATTATKE